jgi:hypothetical protein
VLAGVALVDDEYSAVALVVQALRDPGREIIGRGDVHHKRFGALAAQGLQDAAGLAYTADSLDAQRRGRGIADRTANVGGEKLSGGRFGPRAGHAEHVSNGTATPPRPPTSGDMANAG